ncbi:DUF2530 domain-containing protein [Embleya hyalina]|uniref:DUF2530 domain-containing protein n=1 Tax=Embleya hyalina TaxID=516124 RepID=A0A401YWI9_9ACTN|nr:DUF2530 domain-containing protein [Embleya hyalina]
MARTDSAATPDPVDDTFDAGAPGSGEYAAHGSESYPATDYGTGEHGAADYGSADYGSGEYASTSGEYAATSGEYTATEHSSGEYTAANYADYSRTDYAAPEAAYGSGGYQVAASSAFEPDAYDSGSHTTPEYGASAYDPATDPALGGGTAEFAAVTDAADAADVADGPAPPADREPPAADTGMRPAPPPLEGDIIKLVAVGSVIWFALFVVAWFMRDSLTDDGRDWWPWCALAGSGLGLFGLWYCRRLQSAHDD